MSFEQNYQENLEGLSDEQIQAIHEDAFAADPEKEKKQIEQLLLRMKKVFYGEENAPATQRFVYEDEYDSAFKSGRLKFTQDDIDNGNYSDEDFNYAVKALASEKEDKVFSEISHNYIVGPIVMDSIVRKQQEQQIVEAMEKGTPVLIRGNWRQGKTSMVMAVQKHFPKQDCLVETIEAMRSTLTLSEFQREFLLYDIAEYIAEREREEGQKKFELTGAIARRIVESDMTPLEYWKKYLQANKEKAHIIIDELVNFSDNQEVLQFLAELSKADEFNVALVLHHIGDKEDKFGAIFEGYEEFYVGPLSKEDFFKLVRQPLEGTPIQFSEEAIEKLYEITGGRPIEINKILTSMYSGYEELKKRRVVYRSEDIDIMDLDEFYRAEYFDKFYTNYKKILDFALNDYQTQRLLQLADKDKPRSEIDDKELKSLRKQGLVNIDKSGMVSINGLLFKDFLQQYKRDRS